MSDTELLSQTERISDIFTKIILKTMVADPSVSVSGEITAAQLHALRHIAQHGPCTIGALAEGLCVSQPAATMLVHRMTKRGLVERRPGRRDRRQAEISLTRSALDALTRMESERAVRLGRILELLEPHERKQFVESLERFIAAALKLESSLPGRLRQQLRSVADAVEIHPPPSNPLDEQQPVYEQLLQAIASRHSVRIR